jgi:membrane protease YdiL (CAAX protease family)
LFVVVLIGVGAAWAIDLIAVLLRVKGDQVVPPVLDILRSPIGVMWVIAAIFAIVLQPLAEGLIFYGVLYGALARDIRNNLATCLIIALIYAIVSAAILSAGAQPWYLIVQPFLMALVVGLVRAYTQSAQSAAVARALFGLFFVLSALISLRF